MTAAPAAPPRWRTAGVLVIAAALLVAGLVLAMAAERDYHDEKTSRATAQARILAETVTAALSFDDKEAMAQYVRALRADPDIQAAGIFDKRGFLAAGMARTHLATRLDQTIQGRAARGRVVVAEPVMLEGRQIGTVYLRLRLEPFVQRLLRFGAVFLVVAMAVLTLLVIADYARRMRHANAALTAAMAERDRTEAALRQSQKMEAVGRLTGGIAHDFNNMLAIIIGSLDVLVRRYGEGDPRLARLVHAAMEGAQRAAALTQRLLAFSRLQPLDPKPTDIARCVAGMSELIRRSLGETIKLETVSAGGLWLAHVDRGQLETAMVNLAINARDAMPEGGKLTIETANAWLDRPYAETQGDIQPGQYVLIAVSDTGCGMSREVMAQVFEPFFTTKPVGAGTGLGLSQVHGFVKQSGGHISLYSEVGQGTAVKVYLPRSHEQSARPAPEIIQARNADGRGATVLVVEDDPGVREFAAEALRELGYRPLCAASAEEGLQRLADHAEIAVLLTDVVMPEVNGRVLADRARERRPDLAVLYMTGYTRNAIVHNGALDPGAHLVTKPFTVAQLAAELTAMLGYSAAAPAGEVSA